MDDQQLLIRLADDRCPRAQNDSGAASQPLLVKAVLMRSCSAVAEGLPAAAAEWDLSNLLIDGQPVQRSTVVRWLNHCYMRVHNVMFDDQLAYDEVLSAAALFQLLAFADSVGSGRGIFMACLPEKQLQQMYMQITAINGFLESGQPPPPPQQQQKAETRALLMDGTRYYFESHASNQGQGYYLVGVGGGSALQLTNTAKDAVQAQVAAQAEQLLYIAHKLQLQELLLLVKDFAAAAPLTRFEMGPPGKTDPLLSYKLVDELVYR